MLGHVQQNFDIMVVGAGLVGGSVACALMQLNPGLRVAVADAQACEAQRPEPRAIGVSLATYELYTRWGLGAILAPYATPVRTIQVSEMGCFGVLRFSADDYGLDAFGYMIPAQHIQETLNHCLLDKVTWFRPARVLDMKQSQDHATVMLLYEEQAIHVTAPLVIAVDGSDSVLRSLHQIPVRTHAYSQSAVLANLYFDAAPAYGAYERFVRGGLLALLPLTEGRNAMIWMAEHAWAQRLQNADDTAFTAEIQKVMGYRLGHLRDVGKRTMFPLRALFAAEQVRPSFLILGNAAHTLHPALAQGFNVSMRDIAAFIGQCEIAPDQPKSWGRIDFLKQYLARRQADQANTAKWVDRIVRSAGRSGFPWSLVRGIGMQMMDVFPGAKDGYVLQMLGR